MSGSTSFCCCCPLYPFFDGFLLGLVFPLKGRLVAPPAAPESDASSGTSKLEVSVSPENPASDDPASSSSRAASAPESVSVSPAAAASSSLEPSSDVKSAAPPPAAYPESPPTSSPPAWALPPKA